MLLKVLLSCWLLLCLSSCKEAGRGGREGDSTGITDTVADSFLKDTAQGATITTTTRYDTLYIEGTKETVRLTHYREPNYGVETYIPAQDFIAEESASGEGMAVHFISNLGNWRNDQANVRLFFPAGQPGIDQMRDMTIGPRGLLAINKWRLIKSDERRPLPYPWALEEYTFQHRDEETFYSGSVILGESSGRPVRVTVVYPLDYAEGFLPRARILLKHLKIHPLKEPKF